VTIDLAKEHAIRRLHDVEKWKRGTIATELGVHPDVVDRVLDPGVAARARCGDHHRAVRSPRERG
jgi:hypothetical protein